MGKRGKKPTNWKELFIKKVEFKDDHWIWKGYYEKNNRPVFAIIQKGFKHNGARSAKAFAYFYKYDKYPNFLLLNICGNEKCVNPDHCKNGNEEKIYVKKRNKEMLKLYQNYLKYREYNLVGLGRKYGITKQRAKQILEQLLSKDGEQ